MSRLSNEHEWKKAFKRLPKRKFEDDLFSSIRKDYENHQKWKIAFDSIPLVTTKQDFENIVTKQPENRKKPQKAFYKVLAIAASFTILISIGILIVDSKKSDGIILTKESASYTLDLELMSNDPKVLCLEFGIDCSFAQDEFFLTNWEELSFAIQTIIDAVGHHPNNQFLVNEVIRIENKRIELLNQFLTQTKL